MKTKQGGDRLVPRWPEPSESELCGYLGERCSSRRDGYQQRPHDKPAWLSGEQEGAREPRGQGEAER